MNYFAHKNDCEIIRDNPNTAIMRDCEGTTIIEVPADWTDDQLWMALSLMNKAYRRGVDLGRFAKAQEIRKVISSD